MIDNTQKKSNKKVFKIVGIGLLVLVVLVVLFSVLGGDDKKVANVNATRVDAKTGSPLESKNEDYNNAVKEANEKSAEEALKNGKTHIGVQTNTVDPSKGIDTNELTRPTTFDDLASAGNNQQTMVPTTNQQPVQQIIQERVIIKEVAVDSTEPYDYKKDVGLIGMLDRVYEPKEFAHVQISNLAKREALVKAQEEKEAKALQDAQNQSNLSNNANGVGTFTLYKTGDLIPAVLETGAVSTQLNSPIRARISSGPLRGAILTGYAKRNGEDSLIIEFTNLNSDLLRNTITMKAVAMDYDKATTAMASNVNRHIPSRVLMTFAGSFAKGYSDALKNNNDSTTVVDGGTVTTINSNSKKTVKEINKEALADAVNDTATMINSNIPKTPTVTIYNNLGIGLYVMQDLIIDKSMMVK